MAERLAKGTHTTLLVVDDNDDLLQVVVAVLESAQFHVLKATSGPSAIKLASEFDGKIHLLLSDIEMPEMEGPDLAAVLKSLRPDLRVMFMSGLKGGGLLVLNYGWAFIQKPFLNTKLIEMINDVINSPNKSQGTKEFNTREADAAD